METLFGVILLAIIWHVGVAVVEYHRRPERNRPSFAKLLLLAEVEVLRALYAELKRRRSHKREHRQKLAQVKKRLEELKEYEERADS